MPTVITNPQRETFTGNVNYSDTRYSSEDTVGPRQTAVLMFIGSTKKGQATVRDIADFFDLRDTDARKVVHRLRSRGLVSFSPVSSGRVNTPARLLEAGRRALAAAASCTIGSDRTGLCLTGVPRRR